MTTAASVIDMRLKSAAIPELREKCIEDTEQECDGGTQCHQRIHVTPPQTCLPPGVDVERSTKKDHYREGQYQLDLVRERYMHQNHRKQQHRNNEDPCTDNLPLQQPVVVSPVPPPDVPLSGPLPLSGHNLRQVQPHGSLRGSACRPRTKRTVCLWRS